MAEFQYLATQNQLTQLAQAIAIQFNELAQSGGGGGGGGVAGVSSINGRSGAVTLAAGANLSINRVNNIFTFDVAVSVSSVAGRTGAVTLSASDVGLGNVSNLNPADLPLSTAASNALGGKHVAFFAQSNGGNLGTPGTISTINFTGAASASRSGDVLTVNVPAPAYPVTSVAGKTGAVSLNKGDVGLGNVDNTADADKPISSATQTALNAKNIAFTVQNAGSSLGTAGTVDTINFSTGATVSRTGNTINVAVTGGGAGGSGEANTASNLGAGTPVFAQKNGVDLQFRSFLLTGGYASITNDASTITINVPSPVYPVTSVAGRTGAVTLSKNDVGLGNVDNTSDANKPVSTAQAAINATKADKDKRVAMSANDVDLSQGTYFTKTVSGAMTLTVSNLPAAPVVPSFILELTNGGSAAFTHPSGTKWPGGTAPTLSNSGVDRLGYIYDGTNWNGLVLGKAFA